MLENKLALPFPATQHLLKTVSEIDRFRGKWEVLAPQLGEILQALRKQAAEESTGASTRLEGTGDGDRAEAAGYREALAWILGRFRTIPFQESTLLQLHGVLMGGGGDGRPVGYKTKPNQVTAVFPDGSERQLFAPEAPAAVPARMGELIAWTRERLARRDLHPLPVISLFVYEFACIHPFQEGNGRMARLLTTWLLARMGYGFVQFVSFEAAIERRRREYYRAFMTCHRKGQAGGESVEEWLDFHLGVLLEIAGRLEGMLAKRRRGDAYLNATRRKILEAAKPEGDRGGESFKFADMRQRLPEMNENTLKKNLQGLVKAGWLEMLGEKKGAIYVPGRNASRARLLH